MWITSGATPVKGTVISSQSEQPRSYNVRADAGLLQRNRIHLYPVPDNPSCTEQAQDTSAAEPKRIMTRLQTGTAIPLLGTVTMQVKGGDVALATY